MMDPVEDFLAHYSSANYDPVKAHEYYLKNRELKGRQQSTKGMSDTQKEAWSYTKNKIGTDKKAELTSSRNAQKAKLEQLRNQANETRDRIRKKLEGLLKGLEVKEIKPVVVPKPKLFEIPENATPRQKALFQKQNQMKMDRYNHEVSKAESDARDATKAAREEAGKKAKAAQTLASGELKKISTDLKSAVDKARTSYEASKKATDAKYKSATDTEYNNIRTKLPSAPVKPKSTRKPRAKKAASN